jgi:hypothetical protein
MSVTVRAGAGYDDCMEDDLKIAVQMAMREKAHRRTVLELMEADISDVERVSRVLALEAEHQGFMEQLRLAALAAPAERQDDAAADHA